VKPHGIPRDEWERRFRDTFARQLGQTDPGILDAELESWPVEDDDWLTEQPEAAALENLDHWTD
jgi:hypothetical protein